jgi:hypothetical protein
MQGVSEDDGISRRLQYPAATPRADDVVAQIEHSADLIETALRDDIPLPFRVQAYVYVADAD